MATRRNGAATISADEQPRQQIGIVAAARRIDLERIETDGYRRRAKAEPWQQESWLYYDLLGEVKQPTGYIANACSLARLYVATQPDPEQDPSAPLAGTPGLFEAEDAMDRLRQGAKGGIGGLTRNFTINAKVAGECFLVGLPEQVAIPPGGKDEAGKVLREGRSARQESWQIMSVSQVKSDGDTRGQTYTYRDNPQDQDGRPFPPGAVVIRMWQEHGEWPDLADCALRALLSECETLLILTRMVKATGRSRLAQGGGLLFLASEFDPTPALQPGADGEEPKRFIDRLMEAAETNIREEGTASAVVPIIATGPADLIEKAAKFVDVARALDPLALEQRKEIIQRIGQASDVPMEILVGLRNLNHWCVDAETEALTRRGWVRESALSVGDDILTLNHDTGASEWQPIRNMYRADVTDEPMVAIEGQAHSSLTTPNHRWPVVEGYENVPTKRTWATSETLTRKHRILTAAPCAEQPQEQKWSDAFVELLAWYWTEGSMQNSQVRITQSHTVNPARVARIRSALTQFCGSSAVSTLHRTRTTPAWREDTQHAGLGGPVTIFYLNVTASRAFIEAAPNKCVDPAVISEFTPSQLLLFIDISLQGDGQHYRSGRLDIFQSDERRLDALEFAGILAGFTPTRCTVTDGYRLNLSRKSVTNPVWAADVASRTKRPGTTIRTEPYTGRIWCPATANKTWFARRNGIAYFTGNSSFQVDQSLWDRYGHPTMLLWAESLTVGYLRPMMEEAGVSPDVADRFMVWFDPAGAVVQPDRTTTVIESFDRFIISWETARTILGFSDSDAPSDEEIQQRVDIAIAMKSSPDSGGGGGDPAGGNAPNDGVPPASPQARSVLDALGADSAAVLTAAAAQRRQPVGRRLMQIDRTLRTRLVEAADAAMLHALERAGARVRNYAKRNSRVASAVEDISKLAAWQVPAAVGPVLVASLGLSDDELLANSFDDLQPRFADRVAKAQGAALDAMAADLNLDEGELEAIRSAQQRDRDDAWAWLSGALVSLGLSQLYSPAPDAQVKGEFDADSRVPTGLIREAMARAGGAAGTATGDGRPAGGVALGQLVLDTFARHGQVVSGWQWVYGDPSSRTTPFDGHMDLDGVEFATWDDDALLVQAGDEWLGVTHYRPGDHLWDQCDFVPLGLGSDEQADAETESETEGAAA